MPKFTQIAVSPSFLFALGEDGVVYQLIDVDEQISGGLLTVLRKRHEWKPVTDLEFVNGDWR